MIVSARHCEYLPPAISGVTITHVWPGADDAMLLDPEEASKAYEATTGLVADDGIDYSWEGIIQIDGTPNDVGDWLTALCRMLVVTPSGDDDTFDYWPSGCLLARAVADELGDPWPARVELAIRTGLGGIDEFIRPEIEERVAC
jgi:hypothetical protein